MRTAVTSEATASAGIVTTVACVNAFHAVTAVRSPGLPVLPRRSSSRETDSTLTSGAGTTSTVTPEFPSSGANSGCRRATGLKRHSSSRPVGTGMSARSNEVRRSARDPTGTTPCEWAPSATARE